MKLKKWPLRTSFQCMLVCLIIPLNILLTVSRRYFFCGSFMFYLPCVCYAFVRVCLYVPCGHLMGRGWPLGSYLWCLTMSLPLSHWYSWSGVVLDCIYSLSLHPYLLCNLSLFVPQMPADVYAANICLNKRN